MDDKIKLLAQCRSVEAAYRAEIAAIEADLEKLVLWRHLEQRREYLKAAQVETADAAYVVRMAALDAHALTGDKNPHPAVQVKQYTVLAYDPQAALDYAREHLPNAVKLDKRAFEKAAKAIELDFVAFAQEARATIARDLSEYLEKEK